MWKRVDQAVNNAQLMHKKLEKNNNFIVYPHQSFANVCFWLKPIWLKSKINTPHELEPHQDEINSYTIKIKQIMLQRGLMIINYQPVKSYPNGFRMIFINPDLREKDIDIIINEFETLQNICHNTDKDLSLEKKSMNYNEENLSTNW